MVYYLTFGFAIVFLLYGLVAERTYLSKGQLLPQMDISGTLDLSGAFGGPGGQESRLMRIARAAGLSLGYSSADVIAAMLTSRTVMEEVIEECEIFRHYKIKSGKKEDALKLLETLTKIEISKEDIIQIECIGKSRELAAQIVNSYIRNVDKFLREKSMSQGRNLRLFVEERLAAAEKELETAAESLKIYQERTKIIVPDEELKAAVDAYAGLKGSLFAKEVQADMIEKYSSKESPYYIEARNEINAIKGKLTDLESRGILKEGFGIGFGVPFAAIPEVMQEYFARYLHLRIQEEVYVFLRQQYEQARIMEIKDTPVITVLDWGKPAERRHAPKILHLVILGMVIGLALGAGKCVWTTAAAEYFRKRERRQAWREAKDAILSDVRSVMRVFRRGK